jgi:phosphatidylserine/phosphatidylglycerophosphate/cardiolipin synthase-like enzyme
MKDPGVHVNAVVVDGAAAYAGSVNLSWTSPTKNREVSLLVTDPANVTTMHAPFEKTGRPPPPSTPPPPCPRPPPNLSPPPLPPPASYPSGRDSLAS